MGLMFARGDVIVGAKASVCNGAAVEYRQLWVSGERTVSNGPLEGSAMVLEVLLRCDDGHASVVLRNGITS